MLRQRITTPRIAFYLSAVVLTAMALGLSAALWDFLEASPFLFFIAAVALSAWYGGLGPGLLSAALSILTAGYFLVEPRLILSTSASNLLQLTVFGFVAFLISWVEHHRRETAQALYDARDELDVILNSVAEGITAQDKDGEFLFVNQAAANMMGWQSSDALLATPIAALRRRFDLFDEHRNPMPAEALPRQHVYQTRSRETVILGVHFHDTGEERWLSVTTTPVIAKDGAIKLVVNILRDITTQLEAEEERNLLAAIVQNSEDAIIGKQRDGTITSWNPGAEALYGYSAEEAIGQPVSMLYPKDIKLREEQWFERLEAGERIHQHETRRVRKDGSVIDISLTISPIRGSQGQLMGYSAIGRDITQRLRLERIREENTLFLRKILDSLPILVGVMTPKGVLLEANRATLDTANLPAEDVIGKPLTETYWWSYSEVIQAQLVAAIQRASQGEVVRYDVDMRTGPGEFITVDFTISPMIDAEGRITHLIPSALDISERKHNEEEVLQLTLLSRLQNRRLNNLIANVPGVVYETIIDVATESQQMQYISPYVEKLLGYSTERWQSNPGFWQDIVAPEDWETALETATSAYENKQPGTALIRCFAEDGHQVYLEINFTIHHDEVTNQVHLYGVMMDVTQRQEIEAALAQYTKDLERSNQELEQFAYIASHDLQEPLRKVTSYLQLIEQRYTDVLDQDGKEFMDFAVDGAARLQTLIKDLLSYSRVQRNQGEFQEVDMQTVLDRVLSNLQLTIEEHKAVITQDEMPEIFANENQMMQLFQNLIDNAIKFRGDSVPKVHIGVERRGSEWWFSVRDNGIGIEPAYQERIFAIFQRLHGRGRYPGTGIGLAICKKVVENHDGRIWIKSKSGEGTTFLFALPVKAKRRYSTNGLSGDSVGGR